MNKVVMLSISFAAGAVVGVIGTNIFYKSKYTIEEDVVVTEEPKEESTVQKDEYDSEAAIDFIKKANAVKNHINKSSLEYNAEDNKEYIQYANLYSKKEDTKKPISIPPSLVGEYEDYKVIDDVTMYRNNVVEFSNGYIHEADNLFGVENLEEAGRWDPGRLYIRNDVEKTYYVVSVLDDIDYEHEEEADDD